MVQSKARRANSGIVEFPRFYGQARKPLKPLDSPPVIGGFDIEADAQTADPYLICASLSDGKTFKKTLESCEDVLNFLTQPSFQHSINGFWNISYDTEGMLRFFPDFVKYLLSKNPDVYLTHDLRKGTPEEWFYHIRVIPKKALFVKSVISPVARYFDWAQFYDKERLAVVAQRILGVTKDDFDASKSSLEKYFTNSEYYETVRKYCLKDATLTQQLGQYLVKAVHNPPISLPTRNFTSRASLAGQYFLRNGYSVPQRMRFYYKAFLPTYWGGRFEMTKCGFVPDVFTADIKSAYPKWLAELFILTENVELLQVKNDEWNKKPDNLYAAYRVKLQVPTDNYLGPIPVQPATAAGPIIYPVGDLEAQWIDKETLLYLDSRGYDFQIDKGVELYDPAAIQSLKQPVHNLFSLKENKKNDEGIRTTGKIMMNGGYGKTIELVDDVVGEIMDVEEAIRLQYEIEKVLPEGVYAYRHTGRFQAGSMFCPPYASYITAKTRIQVLEQAEYVGFENTVAIQTDSLSSIHKQPKLQKGLGGWDDKGRNDLAIVKPGFYQFQASGDTTILETGDLGMDPIWKIFNKVVETKSRGLGRVSDITQSEYEVRRRISMRECAARHDFTTQNIITERTLQNNFGQDQKRVWDAQLTNDDARPWGRCIDSRPIVIKT